ncbi:MAG: hypothetical protein ACXVKN_19800, partial [Acidimicrobiia bacterium]
DRFLSPSTVKADGTCPTCGRTVEAGEVASAAAAQRVEHAEEELTPIPWHLKVLASGIAIYLAYRLYQGIQWLVG